MNNGYFGLGGRLAVLAIAGGFGVFGGCKGGVLLGNSGAPLLEPSNLPANEKFSQPDACTYNADFGQVAVGSTGTLLLDLSDTGSSPLKILTVAPPSDAEFSSDLAAGTTVQPGLSTAVNLAFKPFAEGAKSATFTFGTDSSACLTGVTVNMTGTGVILKLVASPQAVNFGQVVVHSSPGQVVTLTNSSNLDIGVTPSVIGGPQASLFSVDKPAGVQFTVPANQVVQMNVTYSPLTPSSLDSANLTLALTAGGTIPITMQGTALQSGLKITPTPLNFAFVQPGDSVTLPLHLANVGNETLTVTSVSVVDPGSPAAFAIANNSWRGGQLKAGDSQDVNVTFSPSILAKYTGELDVSSTDSTNIVPVTLEGFGGGAIINCGTPPLALDFGTVAVGIGASLPVICTNVGSDVPGHPEAGVILSTLSTNSTVFSAQVDPASIDMASAMQPLAAGHSVQIDAIYTPTQTAMDTGSLKINSNVTDGTQVAPPTVALAGNAIFELPCTYSITPQSVQFGEVRPNTTVTGGFTINNLGPNECLVTGLGLGADTQQPAFALLSGTVTSQRLSPPGVAGTQYPTFLQVNIQFAPKQSGSYSGSVRFTISDPTAPYQTVNLSGVGGNSCFLIQPAELDFGTVGVSNGQFCSNGKKKFVGINSCAQSVTIQSATVGGSPAFVFVSEDTPQVVAQGATSTPFVIGFKPMSQGTSDGNVLVQTDLQPTPFGVGLAGSAVNGSTQLDKFAGHTPAVDVLLIMDSDDDLEDLRQPFAMHVGDFVMAAETLGLDFQFGVTSTSDCPSAQPNGEQGKLVPCPNCNINGAAPTIVTNADPNASTDLANLVLLNNVQEDGCPVISDDEHFFDVAYKALITNGAAYNSGFVREDAYLAVIETNGDNEDEQDPQTPQWYANQFLSVKGADHPELFSWSYINPSEYGAPGGHQPFNNLPERIKSMLSLVGGVALDMYQPNWWKGVIDLWNIVLASSTRFPLSGTPDPNSIVVYLDGPPPALTPPGGTPGVEILASNPNGSSNWSYDATSNTIVVNSANLTLSSSDTLYAEYTLICP